jgi:hypothetical protein
MSEPIEKKFKVKSFAVPTYTSPSYVLPKYGSPTYSPPAALPSTIADETQREASLEISRSSKKLRTPPIANPRILGPS